MTALQAAPLVLQALAIAADEFHFHRRRGLGRAELLSHAIDTLFFAVPLGIALAFAPSAESDRAFLAASVVSCLLVTKDEWIHARESTPGEHWLHAVLFLLHPAMLFSVQSLRATAGIPGSDSREWLSGYLVAVFLFFGYQLACLARPLWKVPALQPER